MRNAGARIARDKTGSRGGETKKHERRFDSTRCIVPAFCCQLGHCCLAFATFNTSKSTHDVHKNNDYIVPM